MQQVFSPKQVARAIGASESSVKRWCDRGVLPSIKTAGGHRRLPMSGVIDFLRSENRMLLDPTAIGLPEQLGRATVPTGRETETFLKSLIEGDYQGCRVVLFDMLLRGDSFAKVFDEVVSAAMHQVGDAWCGGTVDVYQERRGCEMITRLMHDLRTTLATTPSDAPLAMGGSLGDDPYSLPNRMVEITLCELGWQTSLLGTGIPIESLVRAIEQYRPRLFWLSVSTIEDAANFTQHVNLLNDACGVTTAFVLGGRALDEQIRKQLKYTVYCENLQRLAAFVQALKETRTITDN